MFNSIKNFLGWIKLFFFLRKQTSTLNIWDYSTEFQDILRGSLAYSFDNNEIVWKLWGQLLDRIETYHRWSNEQPNRSKMMHLRLDWVSPEVSERIPRDNPYGIHEMEYFVYSQSKSDPEPDMIVAGPFKISSNANTVREIFEVNRKTLHRYYVKSYPKGFINTARPSH